jgi:lipoic acid synthetase
MKQPKPDWLKVKIGSGPTYSRVRNIVEKNSLHTVCQEALCPNMGACWENGRATLMILGNNCTRSCSFCNVASATPSACDADEPQRVADAVKEMDLREIVITSVTRDDLADGGADIWTRTINSIRSATPGIIVEVLIPDFKGSETNLNTVMTTKPEVFGHNLETVAALYPRVRPGADYARSLGVLQRAHDYGLVTKTGLMVGLGETTEDVLDLMRETADLGCDILYIGQYLQPTPDHLPVHRYVEPDEFAMYREQGLKAGFKVVVSAPLVRSSYYSKEQADFLQCFRKSKVSDKSD